MSKLPSLTGRQVVKALQKAGFTVIRQKGSHAFLRLHYLNKAPEKRSRGFSHS